MQNFDPKREEIRVEANRVKSLINLCLTSGIDPGMSAADIDAMTEELTELSVFTVQTRLREAHRYLHELLYSPPRR